MDQNAVQIPDQWGGSLAGGPSWQEIRAGVASGKRVVCFECCISFIVVTQRRTSGLYLLEPNELGLLRGLPYTLLTLVMGWWGLPWGVIITPQVLFINLCGGRDVTAETLARLDEVRMTEKMRG
jgi:hypothetical protein